MGDWEGDTKMGSKNRGGLATQVERTTRFLCAGKIRHKMAKTFSGVTNELLSRVPKRLCCTLTFDNGTENATYADITQRKQMEVYFAHPRAPWQRDANEQVNGMTRHYFPKGTDFRKVSYENIAEMVININKRPRKCLNFRVVTSSHHIMSLLRLYVVHL